MTTILSLGEISDLMIPESQMVAAATRSERRVAEALNACGADGVGYFRFSIPATKDGPKHEADFLIVLRGGRLLILESKGCTVGDIVSIDGDVWSMVTSWHSPVERPITQVRDQAMALKAELSRRGASVWVDYRVALPFITKEAWNARGLPSLGGALVFAGDLAPGALRAVLESMASSSSAPAPIVQALGDLLGSAAAAMAREPPREGSGGSTSASERSKLLRLTYGGRPPSDDEIMAELGAGRRPDLYLTATAALDRLRKGRFGVDGVPLQFGPAFRHMMRETGWRWLSRMEARVCLIRAMATPPPGDPGLPDRLRHDAAAWFDALADLDERGRKPGEAVDPYGYVDATVAELLEGLHDRARLAANDAAEPFEAAARRWLNERFQPPTAVVMEGFTRLTPLQESFIDRCLEGSGTHMALIVPGAGSQSRGFRAVEEAHARFRSRAEARHRETRAPADDGTMLAHVQCHLFGDTAAAPVPRETQQRTILVRSLRQRSDEAALAVRYLRRLRAAGYRLDRDVAVVAADPGLYDALMREEDAIRPDRAPLFEPRPRNLLLTPIGRFIIDLYAVGYDGPLDMTARQFRQLVASGWLGSAALASVDLLPAVAAQLLDRCGTEEEWREGLAQVDRLAAGGGVGVVVPPTRRRLPSHFVTKEDARAWQNAFDTVLALRARLFAGGPRTIGQHVERLMDELARLEPQRLDATFLLVMRQVRDALRELQEAGVVEVSAREFGEVLGGLSEPEADGDSDEESPPPLPNTVRVVPLEAIDGVEYPIVLALGLDDRQLPGASLDRWPRKQDSAADWLARQRYRFLAVVRAARRRLVLLRPEHDGGDACRTSPFLRRVEALLGTTTRSTAAARQTRSAASPSGPPRGRGRRDSYSVEELSIASLCSHRWRLEALEPRLKRFSEAWQLEWLAKADWLAACVQNTAAATTAETGAQLHTRLAAAKRAAGRDVKDRFAALRDLEWTGIARSVDEQIDYIVRDIDGVGRFGPGVRQTRPLLLASGRTITIAASAEASGPRRGWRRYVADRDGAWLMHGRKGEPLYQAVQRFAEWSNWVLYGATPDVPIGPVVEALEGQATRRNPGDHCSYCPVRPRCLGLDP